MKKSFSIATIFLFQFSIILNAQFKTWSTWRNFGINYSTINTHDNKLFEIKPKYGINIGLEFPYSLNKHFSFVPEVCITQKGARLVELVPNASAYFDDYNMWLAYLEMPVSLKTSIDYKNIVSFFKIDFYFDINIFTYSKKVSGDTVGVWNFLPYFNRPFDYGFQGGLGVGWNTKYSIQSRLYYGLY